MVIAYHAIFAAYGFWLPNDPRGSWSDFVGAWELLRAGGKPTPAGTRRSVAHVSHDVAKRLAAKNALKFPPVVFDGLQARAVARGFAQAVQDADYAVWACSIMPDHVHMVVRRHERDIETIMGHFKSAATRRLRVEGIDPMAGCVRPGGRPASPWVEKGWSVFLETEQDVRRAVAYVEENPLKEGHRAQHWSIVRPIRA